MTRLEKDLEAMNETWNNLKKSVAEREKKLDECLIRSGKFQVSIVTKLFISSTDAYSKKLECLSLASFVNLV